LGVCLPERGLRKLEGIAAVLISALEADHLEALTARGA
jgi:hypothetical protein